MFSQVPRGGHGLKGNPGGHDVVEGEGTEEVKTKRGKKTGLRVGGMEGKDHQEELTSKGNLKGREDFIS